MRVLVTGGAGFSPEFATLLVGLATYTAAFIAEIVRAGIVNTPKGQIEAARSLAMTELQVFLRVVLPPALVDPVERLAQNMFISAPHVAQVAARAAMDCVEELEAKKATYARSRARLRAFAIYFSLLEVAFDILQVVENPTRRNNRRVKPPPPPRIRRTPAAR